MRFYVSDPWFCNSAWLDRWNRKPHDIYLTGAVSRMRADGTVQAFNDVKFLSVDTAWGERPEVFPDEVIPHIKRAASLRPDAPPPVLWVYPVAEYHRYAFEDTARIDEVFAGDLLVQQAINHALPLSGVVETRVFADLAAEDPARFLGSVLVSPVPLAGSRWADALAAHLETGGSVLLYGPADHADAAWQERIGMAKPTRDRQALRQAQGRPFDVFRTAASAPTRATPETDRVRAKKIFQENFPLAILRRFVDNTLFIGSTLLTRNALTGIGVVDCDNH